MGAGTKPEYPPLLSVGFHPATLRDVRVLCVDSFPMSTTRSGIMDGLEAVVAVLTAAKVRGQLWIDGSFMTEKIEAQDVDVVLCVQSCDYDGGTAEQRAAIDWLTPELETTHKVHSFVTVRYPAGHAQHWFGEWMYAYWIRQFGFPRFGSYMKGMGLLELR